MAALLVAIFAFQLNASMLSPALVAMQNELSTTAVEIGNTQTVFFTAAALFSLFLPRLADLKGRRKVLCGMLLVTGIGCVISALAPNVEVLMIGRVLQMCIRDSVNVNQMPDSSFLYNTDIADLAGAESFHDTQTVQVTGEVVGDHINDELDSNLCWITLQSTKADDYSLVSVLMTNEQAKLIENYGNYNTDGTILQVRGTFYLSCSEHQGLSDIHAKEVTVVKQGSPRKHPVNDAVLWTSCLAVGLGVLSLFTYSFLRERRK